MSTSHIPGPWNYSQESIDPEWWIVTLPGGLIVANVNAHHKQEANARLIAASPDLLAGAEALVEALQCVDELTPDQAKALAQLEAAIVRARS